MNKEATAQSNSEEEEGGEQPHRRIPPFSKLLILFASKNPIRSTPNSPQIDTLAASMAAQTAKKFSGSCIPPQLQSALTVELLAAAATSASRTNRVLPEKPIGLGTESGLARGTGGA